MVTLPVLPVLLAVSLSAATPGAAATDADGRAVGPVVALNAPAEPTSAGEDAAQVTEEVDDAEEADPGDPEADDGGSLLLVAGLGTAVALVGGMALAFLALRGPPAGQ